jgi:hypothetical protein
LASIIRNKAEHLAVSRAICPHISRIFFEERHDERVRNDPASISPLFHPRVFVNGFTPERDDE